MNLRGRAKAIYQAALDAADLADMLDQDKLESMRMTAAMLAEATKPQPKKPRGTYNQAHFIRGQAVYKTLRAVAPTALAYEPMQQGTFARLGKQLIDADVSDSDIATLGKWLAEGGLSWMQGIPAWGQFVAKAVDWIARAKQERAGVKKYEETRRPRRQE